ncbi:MAG: hypothetical protein AAF999_04110 [Pseudomonadota bacterium]
MTRIFIMVFNQLMKTGAAKLEKSGNPLTPGQKTAQKRMRQVMKVVRRLHRL